MRIRLLHLLREGIHGAKLALPVRVKKLAQVEAVVVGRICSARVARVTAVYALRVYGKIRGSGGAAMHINTRAHITAPTHASIPRR